MYFCSVCFFITTEPYKDDNEHKLIVNNLFYTVLYFILSDAIYKMSI